MIYVVKINNKEYEVEVEKGKANLIKTTEISSPAPTATEQIVTTQAAPVAAEKAAPEPVIASGHSVIKAPMPGTIIDIKVSPGDKVKKGDILLILEAMKMENEIVAPTDATITQVLISKGATVDTGESLISMQ